MKTTSPRKTTVCWLTLLLLGGVTTRAAELWVAPGGDDRNPGTQSLPFATIETAQRKARELRRTKDASVADGVTITLRGGTYALAAPLNFRWEDSGTAKSPTVMRSAAGEKAVVSGGVAVRGWQPAGDVAGLPAAARGHVWVADAPRAGGRGLVVRQLWTGDVKAVRARTPNGTAMSRLREWDRAREVATIAASDLVGLRDAPGTEMIIEQQWEIAILRVKKFSVEGDVARVTFEQPESRVEFEHPWPQPILPPRGGGAFFLAGAIEFLDSPGEWTQDPATSRLYYWPREGEDLRRDLVTVPALEEILAIEGSLEKPVEYLRFERVGFAHTAWRQPGEVGHVPHQAGMPMREAYSLKPPGTSDKAALENQAWIDRGPAGVRARAAKHVTFSRCEFSHFGASAIDFAHGVTDSVIVGCIVRDIGGNGVQLGSYQEGGVETHVPYQPTDERVVCARVQIANNLFTDTANEDWGGVGIDVGYAREIAIEHNEVRDTSYTGISVGWGWTKSTTVLRDNRVHANFIHRVATRMCDTAGIYTLSAQPGTVISENRVEAIAMSPYVDRPDHWFYLYTDEGSSFITVRDNWCPAEKFLKNANGPGNVWERNGPAVSDAIKAAAGLEPAYRDLQPGARN